MPKPITKVFFEECRNKVTQCSGMDAPVVLGIGTFHRIAAWESTEIDYIDELLTGSLGFQLPLHPESGRPMGEPLSLASLDHSVSLRKTKDKRDIEGARKSIAAVVIAYPNRSVFDEVIGVLHPEAERPFDNALLPNVRFRKLNVNTVEGWCQPTWAGEDDD
jgi:hypothetical protein